MKFFKQEITLVPRTENNINIKIQDTSTNLDF